MNSLTDNIEAHAKPYVLLVDDEVFNLEILQEILDDQGYLTETAHNGREACDKLTAFPGKYQTVLLDRMMPVMGGMEVANYMREHDQLNKIPVIMQTARATKQDVEEALNAGILYYLTKPFGREDLVTIVESAIRHAQVCHDLFGQLSTADPETRSQATIEFKSLSDAKYHAVRLAQLTAAPARVVVGLYELFVNAIEHGNLGIGFELKSRLLKQRLWQTEVEARLLLPENRDKHVTVSYQTEADVITFIINDQGHGFNFKEYLAISSQRSLLLNGRGMLIAKNLSFDQLSYHATGNEVIAVTSAKSADKPR